MKRILFLILFISAIVYSAEQSTVSVNDFSAGLNTVSKGYTGIPGQGSVVHNLDLWKHPLSMTVRDGFDSVFSIPGIDSFLWNGLHAINFLDGTKKLAFVGDSLGAGYANVYVTGNNSLEYGTIDSFFLVPNDTLWFESDSATFHSFIYITPYNVTSWGSTERLDTSLFLIDSTIIDSLVATINTSSVNSYVTASRISTDTLLIVEDNSDANVSLAYRLSDYYPNPFDNPPPPRQFWTVARQSGYLTSTNRIATRFPATGQLWWAQQKGVTYLGTGTGKAITYDGKNIHTFPTRSPGEPNIIPLTTSGRLDGTYRYAFKYGGFDSTYSDTQNLSIISSITTKIVADSQQVFITDLPMFLLDRWVPDSAVWVEIWRSDGNISALDRLDSLWLIDSILVDSTNYSTITYTDTLSDSLMRANSPESQLAITGLLESVTNNGVDDSLTGARYVTNILMPGAPTIISLDTADYAPGSSPAQNGIWSDGEGLSDVLDFKTSAGFAWMVVAVDTTLNTPSDSSRSTLLYQKFEPISAYAGTCVNCVTDSVKEAGFSRGLTEKVTLKMPYINNDNVLLLLYRGVVIPTKFDTTANYGVIDLGGSNSFRENGIYKYSDSFAVPYYYLIGQYNPGDTVVDTLRYDSLLSRETYRRNAVPPIIKQMVAIDNQLLATDGQYLYESEPSADSVAFDIFSKSPINIDDGDEITTLFVQRGVAKLLKNNSTFQLTRDANGYWRNIEISKNYGSISAFSHAQAPEGDYFLSNDGVRLEDENIYRAQSNIGSLMSNQLNNFTNMSLATKKGCYSTYIDGKYLLSFPDLDTTYVLNKISLPNGQYKYSWSTWDEMVMCGSAMYAVRSDNYIYPGDTLYFIKSGSKGIYRYGTQTTDNGIDVQYIWTSEQMTPLGRYNKQITRFDIEYESTDTVESSHNATFWSEKLTSSIYAISLPRLDTSYINIFELPDLSSKKSWRVILSKNINVDGLASGGAGASLIIKGFSIDLIQTGEYPTR